MHSQLVQTGGMTLTADSMGIALIIKDHADAIAILCGSILGSFKAHNLSPKTKSPRLAKINNIGLGIFAGIALAFHYIESVQTWGAAIIALIASSLSVALIDSLFRIAPEIAKKLVEKWFGVDLGNISIFNPLNNPDIKSNTVPPLVPPGKEIPEYSPNIPIDEINSTEEGQEGHEGQEASDDISEDAVGPEIENQFKEL